MDITRTGYNVVSGKEYICLSGDCTKNKIFSDTTVYKASDVCDASKNDCTAVLGVNWKANTYTIKYDGNGKTGGSTANSTHTYDVTESLTANGFTKTGYSFIGWNTKADGSGTSYTDKDSVKNLTSKNGGTVTLYAVWEKVAGSDDGTGTNPGDGSDKTDDEITENNKTGDVMIVFAWLVGIGALGFGVYQYFYNRREI